MAETRERLGQIAKVYREHPFVRPPLPIEAAAFMAALETAFEAGRAALPAGAASPPGGGPEFCQCEGEPRWDEDGCCTVCGVDVDPRLRRAVREAAGASEAGRRAGLEALGPALHGLWDNVGTLLTEIGNRTAEEARAGKYPLKGTVEVVTESWRKASDAVAKWLAGRNYRALAAAPPPPGTDAP